MIARLLFPALLALSCSVPARAAAPEVNVDISQAGETYMVEAALDAPVSLATAWEVLTDFDHMTSILSSLTHSRVISRDHDTLIVRQAGVTQYGFLSFPYQSEREIQLTPMSGIRSRNLSGTAKRMESKLMLGASGTGVAIRYHAEIVPDSALARIFGAGALRHQIEAQFLAMAAEMQKREADRATVAALLPR